MTGVLPVSGIGLRVSAASIEGTTGKNHAVAVVAGVTERVPANAAGQVEHLDVLVVAYDRASGRRQAAERVNVQLPIKPGATDVSQELLSRLDLPPGRYSLRVAASSTATGQIGSVFRDIDVPDFRKASLSTSGLMVAAAPGLPVAPKDKLTSLVPIVPTSEREFGRDQQVKLFLRIYQGEKGDVRPVAVEVSLTNAEGVAIVHRSDTMEAGKFASNRSADLGFELPIAGLVPGQYLMTVDVSSGKGASERQQMRFAVR